MVLVHACAHKHSTAARVQMCFHSSTNAQSRIAEHCARLCSSIMLAGFSSHRIGRLLVSRAGMPVR